MIQTIFERTEIKYLLSKDGAKRIIEECGERLKPDKYYKGTNCSIYFDTNDKYLAIHSLEKPLYKEKIRLRSYGVPKLNDFVFFEIKKKFVGTGYKRRISLRLRDYYSFCKTGRLEGGSAQICKELEDCFRRYDLKPALFLAYDRLAYVGSSEPDFRVTFDSNVRYRTNDLDLGHGDYGDNYFKNGEIVMEVKAMNAYPIWFVRALDKLKIYPASFSKYGRVMQCLYSNNHEERSNNV